MPGIINENVLLNSLFDYVNDIKPFHVKIFNIMSNYEFSDSLIAQVNETFGFDITLSNTWGREHSGDGITTLFKIPPCVIPRESSRLRKYFRIGKTDESSRGNHIYELPYNNGIKAVIVNGVTYNKGEHYVEKDKYRTAIQFIPGFEPQLNEIVEIILYSIDRLHIAMNDVWQEYTITDFDYSKDEIHPQLNDYNEGAFDVLGLDNIGLDEATDNIYENTWVELAPLGRIIIINGVYYFEFYTAPILGTRLKFNVFQQEAQENTVKTYITEFLNIRDSIRFADTINVTIREPMSDAFGMWPFELLGIDAHETLLTVRSGTNESASISISEELNIQINSVNTTPSILQEDGSYLLLENGDRLILE